MIEANISNTQRTRYKLVQCRFCGAEVSSSHLSRHWKQCSKVTVAEGYAICVGCQVAKPLDDFPHHRNHRAGVSYTCKECAAALMRNYYNSGKMRRTGGVGRPSAWIEKPCKFCGTMLPNWSERVLHEKDCPQKPTTNHAGRPRVEHSCPWCKEIFGGAELLRHRPICSQRPTVYPGSKVIPCKWCGQSVLAKKYQTHISTSCKGAPTIEVGQKLCTLCQEVKELAEFRDATNKNYNCLKCEQLKSSEYYKNIQESRRIKVRENRYQLQPGQYEEMLHKQGGVCAMCSLAPDGVHLKTNRLHVDHNHRTGEIRGLLCYRCNHALGSLRDSASLLRKGADYLDSTNTVDELVNNHTPN